MGMEESTHQLSKQYSDWSARDTVVLASKSDNTLEDIPKKLGYGQRASFQIQKAKAPDEMEMYQQQGLAWVVRGTSHYQ
eukprot:7681299-Karenia_brevis.AAC.1